jgi:hypothetical protein
VFVTAADDVRGITSAADLARRLTLVEETGGFRKGPFTIIEFDNPCRTTVVPTMRSEAGWIPGGQTAGGAREWLIPNYRIDELGNVVMREVQ